MQHIRISINLLKVEGAIVTTTQDVNGKPVYYVSIPASQLFIPNNAHGQAHLTATLVETPANQYSDFAIRPYVSPSQFNAMSDEQRRALPFIGSGKYMQPAVSTAVTSSAVAATFQPGTTLPPTQSEAGSAATLYMAPPPAEQQQPAGGQVDGSDASDPNVEPF